MRKEDKTLEKKIKKLKAKNMPTMDFDTTKYKKIETLYHVSSYSTINVI